MFLKKLEIYGFKSFPYKVTIPFSAGITGIVGPNGAGKSNVLDAIKWVLGEQSSKKLRVKELSDLIFAGNEEKKKVDFAEVRMTINHDPPVWEKYKDFPEVVITRRFYRNGESEFFINQKPCRLKDIQFLFLELGINTQSYSIIDQGEVSKFIEMSLKERRVFLEDLAGVSKFKVTEEETKKNLKLTEENLIRLTDILKEVENQYYHLKNQAEEAKRYLSLKAKLEDLILKKNLYLWKKNNDEKQEIEGKIIGLKDEVLKKEKEIESLEKEEHRLSQELLNLERLIRSLKDEIESKEKVYKDWEGRFVSLLKEEKELAHKIEKEKLKEETEKRQFEALESEKQTIEENLNRLKEQAEKLKINLEEIRSKKENLLKIYEEKISQFQRQEETYFNLQKELEKISEKRRVLEREIQNLIKEKEATERFYQELKKEKQKLEKENILWDKFIEEKTEKLQNLVKEEEILVKEIENLTQEADHLKLTVESLKAEKKSLEERISLINKILPKKDKQFLKNLPFKLEFLPNFLIVKEKEDLDLLESVFKEDLNALLVDGIGSLKAVFDGIKENEVLFFKDQTLLYKLTIEKKEELTPKLLEDYQKAPRFIYVKKEGILFTPLGFIYILKKKFEGKISLQKELETLLEAKVQIEKRLQEHMLQYQKVKEKISSYQNKHSLFLNEIKGLKEAIEKIHKEKQNFNLSWVKIEEKEGYLKDRVQQVYQGIERLSQEKEEVEKHFQIIQKEINKHKETYQKHKNEKNNLENQIKEIDSLLNKLLQEIVQIKTRRDGLLQRKAEIQKQTERFKNNLKTYQHSVDLLKQQLQHIRERLKEVKQKKDQIFQEIENFKKELETLYHQKTELEKNLRTLEQQKRQKEKEIKNIETTIYNLEIRLTEKKLFLENLIQVLEGTDFNSLALEAENLYTQVDLNDLEREIRELKEALKTFNEINLASIKEFETVSERYYQLLNQKEDLEKGITKLQEILENLKNLSKEKLETTLQEVNQKLSEIFSLIFKGGDAQLVFTGDDPLTAGLDFQVKIPGKNIKHLNMLSGGEKALCVLAILIAFYLVKPGPFCIFDEVDAPLDEKNSLKFIRLLNLIKKNSQIILITHNPNVMKEVDTLLGVTMEEKGISKVFIIKPYERVNEGRYQEDWLKHAQR
ncbi:AAA family ATPase [Thermodesulfobacterium sp. TA1]|uniref:AAA family ATPase n=1 Tax=Thermodesulfobacterium sp. TA1 TaxID=2234087 RepID=UPI00143D9401|nr:AAA family ATPase [Thermodesulfobacterium sp. TA1]